MSLKKEAEKILKYKDLTIEIQRMWNVQGGSNMTGTDLYVNKPHSAAAVRP